jgi:hypothetical protein
MSLVHKGKRIVDNDIVKVKVNYVNFDGIESEGILEVHKDIKDEVISIFSEIKQKGFPIFKIETIDKYDFDDEKSVVANNSSAYNFRFVSGSTKLSDHSIGLAIDINPKQNPWVSPNALNKFTYVPGEKGTIEKGDEVVSIFEKYGWSWGGNWRNPDYQHFFKGGDINKRIKNKLYDDLGIDNPYLTQNTKGRISKFKDFIRKIVR